MSDPAPGIAAVRGAIQIAENRAEPIREATARLLTELMRRNGLAAGNVVSAIFTATPDLDSDFPAHAARRLGWRDVPLLGAVEMAVPGAPPRIVRVLLTVTGLEAGRRLEPVYLDGAATLRPDLGAPAASGSAPCGPSPGTDATALPAGPAGGTRPIAIIGLGQIGGSVGLALARGGGWLRTGFDRDANSLERALREGAIDRAARSIEEACADAELAVIATPADALAASIGAAAEALPPGAALLDTGSARRTVTPALRAAAARGIHGVGGHPLAGSEGRGFDSARAGMFEGASFALCPLEAGVPEIVHALLAALGAAALIVDPGEHDHALARSSHLPYLLACALDDVASDARSRGLHGPALLDMTRVARSDPRVAEGYCRANLDQVRAAWHELAASLEARLQALEASAPGGGAGLPRGA